MFFFGTNQTRKEDYNICTTSFIQLFYIAYYLLHWEINFSTLEAHSTFLRAEITEFFPFDVHAVHERSDVKHSVCKYTGTL